MEIPLMLGVQFLIAFVFLGIAALKDLVDNAVPNVLWVLFGVSALTAAIIEFGFTALLAVHLVFTSVVVVGAYVAWRVSKGRAFGGADSKAIMALGFGLPINTFVILGYAAVLVLVFLFYKTAVEKMALKDAVKIKAPFIPFLFLGLVLTALMTWVG